MRPNCHITPLFTFFGQRLKIHLLLATDVSGIDPSELKLFVDEDIYGYDETMTKSVIVPQGVYLYNPNLGEYGGYSVNYSYHKTQ